MKTYTKGLLFAATFAASGFASAAYIDSVSNGNSPGDPDEQTVPGDNDYATRAGGDWTADAPLYEVGDSVDFGHNLKSTTDGPFKLTFTYLGKEANNNNQFWYNDNLIFDTNSTVDDEFSTVFNGGTNEFLDFFFVNGAPGITVNNDETNGSQFVVPVNPNTSVNFNLFEVSEDYFLISFDDGYSGDDNHDDMVLAVRASEVPEPGTLALLGLGLAGLALRRKAKA